MEVKDIIDRLQMAKVECEWNYPIDYYIAFDEAIKLLEKQITEKVEWDYDGHHIRCPLCNVCFCILDQEGDKIPTNFCPKCGTPMIGIK